MADKYVMIAVRDSYEGGFAMGNVTTPLYLDQQDEILKILKARFENNMVAIKGFFERCQR